MHEKGPFSAENSESKSNIPRTTQHNTLTEFFTSFKHGLETKQHQQSGAGKKLLSII